MHRPTHPAEQAIDAALGVALPSRDSQGAWGDCPNCGQLLSTQATDCPHCGAIVGAAAAWHVREVPGLMPTPAEAGTLAAAARRRAERAAGMEARRRGQAQPAIAASLGQQLLDSAERLELAKADTVAESEAGLNWVLLATVVIGVPAVTFGGALAFVIGGGVACWMFFALADRERGFQRTVVMDMAHSTITVDISWPHLRKTHHRSVPAKDLRLRLDGWDTGCEGSTDVNWRVVLVLPHDADDPGDTHITLAVYGSGGADAARGLCSRLASHLGLAADALQQSADE